MRSYKPWYRKATNTWDVEVAGKQNPPGKHPEELPPPKKGKNGWVPPPERLTAFARLMACDPANLPKHEEIKVSQVCDLFLNWSQKHHKPDTYNWYRYFLQSFSDKFGQLARDLKPLHVTRWLNAK